MKLFKLSILAADHLFFEGECESIILPTSNGEFGILANHCNMVAAIVPGILKYTVNGEKNVASVSEGIVKVEAGEVLVLVDTIERPEDIDVAEERRQMEESKEALLQKQSINDYYISKARLARSLARLKTKEYQNKHN